MTRRTVRQVLGAMKELVILRAQGVPFPPLAPRLGAEGLYIGASNSAGQGWAWARALERALPAMRAVSSRFEHERQTSAFSFDVDLPVSYRYAAHSASWQRQQFSALSSYRAIMIESGDPILARLFGGDTAAQARALRQVGPLTSLLFHGSDIRDPDRHLELEPHSHFAVDPGFTETLRELTARNQRLIATLDAPVFVSTPDLLDEVPEAAWLPVVVDVARWERAEPPLNHDGPVRVAHVPSSSLVKGTELIAPLLDEMAAAGAIQYTAIQGIPHSAMPEVYGEADVVVDQFRVGNYGVAACEALAAGRIVVSHVSDRVREHTRELTGEELPVVEATPETLQQVLRDIAEHPARYLEVAARGPAFVREHHDGRRSGRVLAEWLETA